jgi:hypothetical protein
VNAWWWVPIGLAAWFVIAAMMALWIGSVLGRAARTRESLDRQRGQTPGEHESRVTLTR